MWRGNACSPESLACVDCYMDDTQCADGTHCAADSTCVECLSDAHCGTGSCLDRACVPCVEDAQCQTGHCKNNACVECVLDEHCASERCALGVCEPCKEWDCPDAKMCASSGECEDPLLPFADATWTYRMTKAGTGEAPPFHFCQDEEYIHGFLSGPNFRMTWFCASSNGGSVENVFRRGDEDQLRNDYYGGSETMFLDMPLEIGHEGTSIDGSTLRWSAHGQVTTPAGTFDDCWTREDEDSNTYTFCRGVGLTRAVQVDASGYNGFIAELASNCQR